MWAPLNYLTARSSARIIRTNGGNQVIEAIFAIWAASFVLSWAVASFFIVFVFQRRAFSEERRVLNDNLAKVGLFWSSRSDDFVSLAKGNVAKDRADSLKSILLMTTIFSVLSFIGLLCTIVMHSSMAFLARSRLELNALASPLATDRSLSADQVGAYVADLRNLL